MPRRKDAIPQWKWQVKPTFSVHFVLNVAPTHPLSAYGFKSEDEIEPLVKYLENNADVTSLMWVTAWKETRMSRWMRKEHRVRG